MELTLRGSGHVRVELRLDAPDNPPLCQGETVLTGGWETPSIPMPIVTAAHAVYFAFAPAQPPQFERFAFSM